MTMTIWTSPRAKPAPVATLWQADAILVTRGREPVDRLRCATGPHTWDERKRHRIERRRPFPGRALGVTAAHSGMLG